MRCKKKKIVVTICVVCLSVLNASFHLFSGTQLFNATFFEKQRDMVAQSITMIAR